MWAAYSFVSCGLERLCEAGQQKQGEWSVVQRHCADARIPFGNAFILRVYDERDLANFSSCPDAAPSRSQQKLTAVTLSLERLATASRARRKPGIS